MLNSPIIQADSDKRLRSSITRHHKTDLVKIPSADKFDDINNNHYDEPENNVNGCHKQDLALNDHENDSTLLTTTMTTTVEVK
ncbi:unnamed protein product [Adineta ricciae]|nr:unnamed protein product [Adineta ricciae]